MNEVVEKRNVHVYDVEIVRNCFMLSACHVDDENDQRTFIIWEAPGFEPVNELPQMLDWLWSKNLQQIGFNNFKFDYQIIHWIMAHEKKLLAMKSTQQVVTEIFYFVQELMGMMFPPVAEWQCVIPQRDVYLIHHFDNKNKAVSLKALQIAMHWPNVMDMPFSHHDHLETWDDVLLMKEYNINDVMSTRFFYWKSIDLITLRHTLSEKYQINLRNANEAKIGQEIILSKVAQNLGVTVKSLRPLRTERPYVNISECILPFIVELIKPPFDEAFIRFCNMVVDNTINDDDTEKEKKYGFSLLYDDMQYDFGIGGLHAVRPPGVYSEDATRIIISADVTSYYPMFALKYGFAPAHLGKGYTSASWDIFNERKTFPKGTPENYALKIALNGSYGKSRDKYSPLYDPKYTMEITINGQLLLVALCQMVTAAGATVIMANTDGIEMFCPREKEGAVREVMQQWSERTLMPLEYKQYKKLFIRDVNNYIAVFMDDKTYNKGAYEWRDYDEKGQKVLAWHKDHSMLAVPYAVENYLVRGVPIEESFRQCDFKRFYIGKRAKVGGKFQLRTVVGSDIEKVRLGKTARYIVTQKGGYMYKQDEENPDPNKRKKYVRIDSPWKVTLCMREPDASIKDIIDYRYYKREAVKLMHPILNTQEKMYSTIKKEENGETTRSTGLDRTIIRQENNGTRIQEHPSLF